MYKIFTVSFLFFLSFFFHFFVMFIFIDVLADFV